MLPLIWFLFVASATFWLPAHEGGDIDRGAETLFLVPVYAVIAAVAALGVRKREQSVRDALVSTLPILALLAGAAVLGVLSNDQRAEYRGGPLYLYFGVTLWVSWAVLMVAGALVSRRKWNTVAGITLGMVVAFLGYTLFIARID